MAQVNPLTRELLVKLVFYGPGLGGKTTSLQSIHANSPAETRGQLVSLATPVDRTLYFDFLPLRAARVRGHHVRLQLFTVPGQVYLNATRKLVLAGADGVVFVADSQRERLDANLESLENLAENLAEQGDGIEEIPLVFQYNKRDLPGVVSLMELDRELNERDRPSFATVATTGEGVLDVLDRLVTETLEHLEAKGTFGVVEGSPSLPPEFPAADHALADQIEQASEEIWRQTGELALDEAFSEVPGPPDEEIEALARASEIPSPPAAPDVDGQPITDVHAALGIDEPRPEAVTRSEQPPAEAVPESGAKDEPTAPAPRVSRAPARSGLSFASMMGERAAEFADIEERISLGYYAAAVAALDGELSLALEAAAADLSSIGESGDPSSLRLAAAAVLGIGGQRLARVRRIARRVAEGGPVSERDALEAYALTLEVKLRNAR